MIEDFGKFVKYFEKTWIGPKKPDGTRGNPRFDISVWNYYKLALEKLPYSTCSVES